MRGKKAKEIRKKVYGDQSLKIKREYVDSELNGAFRNRPGSLRAVYQEAKKHE